MAWARAAEQRTDGAASFEHEQVHPFAGRVVWPIAAVVAVAHLVAAVVVAALIARELGGDLQQ